MKKPYFYHTTTFIIFWLIRIIHINDIIFLWPQTIQQITPTEKIETDLLITLTTSIIFTSININIIKSIKKKKSSILNKITLYIKIKITFWRIITWFTIKNKTRTTSNLITWTRIKKFYQFLTILIITLTILTTLHSHTHTRITHIPLTILITFIRPRDPLIRLLLIRLLIIPPEINKIIKNTHTKLKS